MVKELFYELKNGKVLLYDLDGLTFGSFGGEEHHLRYLTQAPVGEIKDLEVVLQQIISERMNRIPRRTKQIDTSTFEFTAKPINREYQLAELPIVKGQYANPYYQAAGFERREFK